MTSTAELVDVERCTTGDPADASHIVLIPPHLKGLTTPQAYVMDARINGTPVMAMCGYTWVPQKDPLALPVCGTCLDIYRDDPQGHGDRSDLPDA